jgi:hypothetical protein
MSSSPVSHDFQAASALGWLSATAVALALTYGPYSQVHGPTVSVHVAALYNSVERTAWGLCVAWVLFACCNGSGGDNAFGVGGWRCIEMEGWCAAFIHLAHFVGSKQEKPPALITYNEMVLSDLIC